LLVLGLSDLSYRWIEKPAQRGLRYAFGVSGKPVIDSRLPHPA
jgi:peptidoglycan/LPS O-acetylase OafA/YrhL